MRTFNIYSKLACIAITLITLLPSLIAPCSAQTIFFATTTEGGSYGHGAIISFDPATNKDSVVWSFAGYPTDGAAPRGNLVYDAGNGLFYGMTPGGGSDSLGAIFSFDPNNYSEHLVWSFEKGNDAASPQGDLTYNASKELFYGMTNSGGAYGRGTIFSFNPASDKDSVLWSFGNGTDGALPLASLVYDSVKGLYYGMTTGGGTDSIYGKGTIISFDPNSGSENVLWDFGSGTDGSEPEGNFVYDASNGLFYAMTFSGGSTFAGSIISFDPGTDKDSVLWSFTDGKDGGSPNGDLAYDTSQGLFYAVTSFGGLYGFGTIIRFDPVTNKDSVLWTFATGTDGYTPYGSLVYDPGNGLFYGTTSLGGTKMSGTIFTFDPANASENVVLNFDSASGGKYPYGNLVPYNVTTGINSIAGPFENVSIYPNPTNGEITIAALSKGQIIELYNDLGQKISGFVANNTTQQLNISDLASGIYVVRISDYDGRLIAGKKMVKVN